MRSASRSVSCGRAGKVARQEGAQAQAGFAPSSQHQRSALARATRFAMALLGSLPVEPLGPHFAHLINAQPISSRRRLHDQWLFQRRGSAAPGSVPAALPALQRRRRRRLPGGTALPLASLTPHASNAPLYCRLRLWHCDCLWHLLLRGDLLPCVVSAACMLAPDVPPLCPNWCP